MKNVRDLDWQAPSLRKHDTWKRWTLWSFVRKQLSNMKLEGVGRAGRGRGQWLTSWMLDGSWWQGLGTQSTMNKDGCTSTYYKKAWTRIRHWWRAESGEYVWLMSVGRGKMNQTNTKLWNMDIDGRTLYSLPRVLYLIPLQIHVQTKIKNYLRTFQAHYEHDSTCPIFTLVFLIGWIVSGKAQFMVSRFTLFHIFASTVQIYYPATRL